MTNPALVKKFSRPKHTLVRQTRPVYTRPVHFVCDTWNVDGDDEIWADGEELPVRDTEARAEAVCGVCLASGQEQPHAVFLQEVTEKVHRIFLARFNAHGYDCFPTEVLGKRLFSIALLKRDCFRNVRVTREEFAVGSDLGRDLLTIRAEQVAPDPMNGGTMSRNVLLMTAHLESSREGAVRRQQQFAEVVRTLAEHKTGPALFAGDTNLRQSEVDAEPLAASVADAWALAGCPPRSKFTFDLMKNHNCPLYKKTTARAQYDRIFVNELAAARRVLEFDLIGTEKVVDGRHPSDHFGIRCRFRW